MRTKSFPIEPLKFGQPNEWQRNDYWRPNKNDINTGTNLYLDDSTIVEDCRTINLFVNLIDLY